MAVSKTPRKKKPANISKAERRLRILHRDLNQFIKDYQDQQTNLVQWDTTLRVFAHQIRAVLLSPSHPDVQAKYLPGYLDQVVLSDEQMHDADLHFFAFIMSKNQTIRDIRKFNQNGLEQIRALRDITAAKQGSKERAANRKHIDDLEIDCMQALLNGTVMVDTLAGFISIRDELLDHYKEHIPALHDVIQASSESYRDYLKTLPSGEENIKAFGEDEKHLEDFFVEKWNQCREDYVKELNGLYLQEMKQEDTAVEPTGEDTHE